MVTFIVPNRSYRHDVPTRLWHVETFRMCAHLKPVSGYNSQLAANWEQTESECG